MPMGERKRVSTTIPDDRELGAQDTEGSLFSMPQEECLRYEGSGKFTLGEDVPLF